MTLKTLTAVAAAAAFLLPGSANAVRLDFAAFIDNPGPGGTNPDSLGETAVEGSYAGDTFGGVGNANVPIPTTMRGYSGNMTDGITGTVPYAYHDAKDAGAGVCGAIDGDAQCDPASDDNLTTGEILGISFGQNVLITDIFFTGEGHPNNDSGTFDGAELFDFSPDGGTTWFSEELIHEDTGPFNLASMWSVGAPIFLTAGTELLFAFNGTNGEQYYVSQLEVLPGSGVNEEIPLPASVLFLLSGLAGLFVAGRRRAA